MRCPHCGRHFGGHAPAIEPPTRPIDAKAYWEMRHFIRSSFVQGDSPRTVAAWLRVVGFSVRIDRLERLAARYRKIRA